MEDLLRIGSHTFRSRLFIGTGKYKSVDETRAALEASGAEVITVALRRVNLKEQGEGSLMGLLTDKNRPWKLLPNTAGCYTAEEAVRTCRLARELGLSELVKLEVIGDQRTLFPDNEQTLEAAKILVKEGFTVLPYCIDDPIICRKLEEAGCAAVMPLAAPIGSGLGIRNPHNLEIILEQAKVPVIVDAGVGTASDAAVAMELGCHGVLMNTAIALAQQPILMAEAMREAVSAGRKAYLAGRMPRRLHASASSPPAGVVRLKPCSVASRRWHTTPTGRPSGPGCCSGSRRWRWPRRSTRSRWGPSPSKIRPAWSPTWGPRRSRSTRCWWRS